MQTGSPHCLFILCMALICASLPLQAPAVVHVETSYTLTRESVELPPGSIAAYEYALAEGSELVFRVQLARWRRDPLRIWLVDEHNYDRLLAGRRFDYISDGTGMIRRQGQIAYPVTKGSRYFAVLDNSMSNASRNLDVYAYALTNEPGPGDERIRLFYEAQIDALAQLIDLGDIGIQVRRCGQVNAYAVGSRVVICRELENFLSVIATPGVRRFILLHEISHSLIDSWGYRSIVRNQFLVDRLAAALFAAIDEDGSAESAAAWFSQDFSVRNEAIADEFAMSKARARRIARWLREDGDLDRIWTRRIVVPRIYTPGLEALATAPHLDEISRSRVRQELHERSTVAAGTNRGG